MKNIPDDTIFRTKKGTRVRIVKPKEFPVHPDDPAWLKEIKARPRETLTVAEVKNGKRWHGYTLNDLISEKDWLLAKNRVNTL